MSGNFRPWVATNMAMTADGKITSTTREEPGFTSPHDKYNMDKHRAEADAVINGAESIRSDNPHLGVRDPDMQAYRRSLNKSHALLSVVVSSSGNVPPTAHAFNDPTTLPVLATTQQASPNALQKLPSRVEIWKLGQDRVDPGILLEQLAQRGVKRVMLEGGAELNGQFLEADLIDELFITIAPALLGGRDAPSMIGGQGFTMGAQRRLRLMEVRREGDELFLQYQRVRR